MATALAATSRIQLQIAVPGVRPHLARHYCKAAPSGGGSYNVTLRDSSTVLVSTIAESWIDSLSDLYPYTQVPSMNWTLESLISGLWVPVASGTHSLPHGPTTSVYAASQVTLTLRDTGFHKVRSVMMETYMPVGVKSVSLGGIPSPASGWAGEYTDAFIGTNATYQWVVGRSNLYLLAGSPIVGYVTDLNDKIRRERGIA